MTSSNPHALVVGGGVIGAFTAWWLTRCGQRVTLIERGRFGAACSHGNCGLVSASHVLPLCGPGQVRAGLKGFLGRNGPLCIRPQLRPSFWTWMLRFAAHCNAADVLRAGAARHALLHSSAALYRELVAEHGLEIEWTEDGVLLVFREHQAFEAYRRTDAQLSAHFGLPARAIEGSPALTDLEPALKPGLAGAWLYPGDAALRPDDLMRELRRLLEAAGVTIRERCEFRGLSGSGERATRAETSDGVLEADAFVVCAGAWTPFLRRELGVRLPIEPGKGYSITMARPEPCPRRPLILEEVGVAITPFRDGYRIGSTMEFAGFDATLDPRRLETLRRGAAAYLREPTAEPVQEEWFGWRPMTPDEIPFIGPSPRFANTWVAAGHGMLGLSMGPATGKLVAELVGGRPPHVDPAPYRVGRA